METRLMKWLRDWIETLAISAILTTFILTFVGRSCIVVGSSMEPTLHTGERLMVERVSVHLNNLEKGDIVVFEQDWSNEALIKRLIGIPGDCIEIRDTKLWLNGEILDEPYLSEPIYEDYGPVWVPEDTFFVLGDNRNNSNDSRGSVGFLAKELLIGRALVRFWPITKATVF